MRVDLRPASSRYLTSTRELESLHSFSYGPHYDAANVSFGVLVAHNADVLQPGGGFAAHAHHHVDIVTWVIEGELEHRDDHGGVGRAHPGVVQRLSAGSGVRHSETNAAAAPARYLQMWIATDDDDPSDYAVAPAGYGLDSFSVVAADVEPAPVRLRRRATRLLAARVAAGASARLPACAFVHVYAVRGVVRVAGFELRAGDAARISDAGELVVEAGSDAEVLAWVMDEQTWRPD